MRVNDDTNNKVHVHEDVDEDNIGDNSDENGNEDE